MNRDDIRHHVIKGDTARDAVLDQLAERYEWFAEREQFLRAEGKVVEAEGCRRYSDWLLRAYTAEHQNP